MAIQGKKILIIDDSHTNVVLLQAILGNKGYNTITASNAKEAYLIMENEKPDLILLDLLMPEISGFDFLFHIKSNKETRNIPVIVVSAVTDTANINRALALGAKDYIKKPIELQLFIEKVNETLS